MHGKCLANARKMCLQFGYAANRWNTVPCSLSLPLSPFPYSFIPSLPSLCSLFALTWTLFLRDNRPNLLFIRLKSHSTIEQLTASRSQSELPQLPVPPPPPFLYHLTAMSIGSTFPLSLSYNSQPLVFPVSLLIFFVTFPKLSRIF